MNTAPIFAIADCNNFYASCERVFQPKLNGRPVVVLSNNDGCVIARSNEAKALGIKMGAPYFKIEPYAKQEGIAVFSSNYALYGDMSQRVMQVLASFAPRFEVYSIDECFLDFTGLPQNLTDYSLEICAVVKQWTGIPISIGIAPTKTLAKLANRLAKNGHSHMGPVLDWRAIADTDAVLKTISLDDLWGISRRWKDKLNQIGIHHALALKQSDPKHLRQHFGVVMERIVTELNGISCIALEEIPAPKKQILTSRSFGERLTDYDDLRAAVTHFATRSAEKCRRQQLTTQVLTVFIHTSPFDTSNPQYSNSATIEFDNPTSNSALLIAAAQQGLKRIFRNGFSYQRAGILLPDLWPASVTQLSLFDSGECSIRSDQLMTVLDDINRKHGKRSIRYASEIISKRWQMRQQFKSPSYTTNINELLTIQI
ncbi:Y-family DNA polymerase [Methylomonas sp. LL1]|uniref:Y-family DNA polymerase n=1 Tax=Methylomonas sp. LL1 TaxID=2785785 RepID=UPI0018C3C3FD|nr:Y-family DNA polymerase [Methylomonas sp. LL1]QPK62913.1 Y-family DNA polymerase [Methylomonas sp. LL1]